MRFSATVIAMLVCGLAPLTSNAQAPFSVGGDPVVVPGDFQVTTFASGLDWPFGLAVLQDESLLVGVNTGGNYFGASGELLRLVDADDDGVADDAGSILYSSFGGFITSLARAGDFIFVSVSTSSTTQTHFILRQGATPSSPITLEGSIVVTFPGPWEHRTSGLDAREAPGLPGQYELYFSIGSEFNAAASTPTVAVSGLIGGTANTDSLYRVIVDDTGVSLAVTNLLQIASGLRNGFSSAFDPASGDLYIQDNGIDGLVDANEPTSADELNVIAAAQIGGAVEDFGFPNRYVEYRTGNLIGAGGIDPVIAYQPVPPPNGAESEGPVDIVFAPPLYPVGLREGVLVGFHGKFSAGGVANEENPLVYTDLGLGTHFHFVSNTEPGIGHPDSLAATGDRLFMADMSAGGGFGLPGDGAVYRIRYVASPAVPTLSEWGIGFILLALMGMGFIAGSRLRGSPTR